MASLPYFVLVLVALGVVLTVEGASRHITRDNDDDEDRYEEEIRALQRRLPESECREQFEPCRGVPNCCADLVCYWENGFSLLKDGECVTCVDRSLTCQRDAQCCENTVCQTDNPWDVDGVCELQKNPGDECYRNAQCRSDDCDKAWYEVHGTCR